MSGEFFKIIWKTYQQPDIFEIPNQMMDIKMSEAGLKHWFLCVSLIDQTTT